MHKLHSEPLTPVQVQNNREWIAALRSGTYWQGTYGLLNHDRYCCLGVACAVKNLATEKLGEGGYTSFIFPDEELGNISFSDFLLYSWAMKEFGINEAGSLKNDVIGDDTSLSSLNDELGFSFAMIADVIEYSLNNAQQAPQ